MKKRKRSPLAAGLAALAAKDTIEGYYARQPAGRVEEDGSYRTRAGGSYDPETRTVSQGIGSSAFARRIFAKSGPTARIDDRRKRRP